MPGGLCDLPPISWGCDGAKDVVGGTIGNWMEDALRSLAAGLGKVVQSITSLWLKVSTPGIAPTTGKAGESINGATSVAQWLDTHTLWLSSVLTGMCLVIAGARMAYSLRGSGEEMRNILHGMVKIVLINGTFIPGIQIAITVGDAYTNWIIDQSLGGNADEKLGLAALSIANLSGSLGGPGVPLILVFFACVFSLLQLIIMYFRAAVLVLLAGTIAIPASTAITGMGSRWLSKWLSWTLAFLLLKPAAATVYAAAYRLMGSGTNQDLGSGITGFVLLSASVIVLPALLRLMQPAGVALTSGGSFGGGADAVGRLSSMDTSGGPSGSSSSGMSAQSSPAATESPTGASNVGLSKSTPSGGVSDGGSLGSSTTSAGTSSAGAGTASAGAGTTASAGTATAGTATAGTGSTVAAGSAAGPVGVGVAIGAAAVKAGKDKVIEGFEEATEGGGPSGS
ncbi:hypothetical protein BX261_7292 [Streptomyces sp. 2321.6]|uniref:hypothetical protein n=1 Tax=Streptomyces sp. 2321.6 TaxID=1938840 RepID=UPI000BB0DC6C|nr:hypothetical protein [Streptomyces sp. 2321.6]PBC72418.1 hypothetical protein BX261_7292 [Streptomyces sp. 2321.6]